MDSVLKRHSGFLVVVVVSMVFLLWSYAVPFFVTQSRVEDAARIAESRDLVDGYCFDYKSDWWGNPICIRREKAGDNLAILYIAVAPGRDGKVGTDDDYTKLRVDFNKSKIVGRWVGNRLKQFAHGFVEGENTPNRHDK